MACPGIFSNMKTAQSITFFIRQLRPTARGHSILPHAPGRIFVQPRNPLRSPTSTLNNLSKPYSTRTQAHDGLLTQKTPPGASFAPNQCTTDSTSSSLPGKPPIIENPDTKAFSASIQTQRPSYQIHFTCKPCGFRSAHEISKHGYHSGSILVTCPSCKNRHVISDHLKIFSDVTLTIEDLMKAQGQLVKRGSINGDGDIEFWKDGNGDEPQNPQKSNLAASATTE